MSTRILVDLNIIYEILYSRERKDECLRLLNEYKKLDVELYILHFDLHALSARTGNLEKVRKILLWILSKGIKVIYTNIIDEMSSTYISQKFNLDFDDALHYYIVKKYNLDGILSFDKDFDKKDIKRLEPKDLLKG